MISLQAASRTRKSATKPPKAARGRDPVVTARMLVEATPLAVVRFDTGGRVRSFNLAAERLLGWSKEDVVGAVLPLISSQESDRFQADFKRALRGETITGREVLGCRRDGALVHLSLSMSPVPGAEGRATSVVAVMADFTERKLAEQKLARDEKLFRTLVEAGPDLVALVDPAGRIRYASPSAERVLGYRPEELQGRALVGLVPVGGVPALETCLERALETPGLDWPVEWPLRHREGPYRTLRGAARGVTDPRGVVVTVGDVTRQQPTVKRLEEIEARYRALFDHNPVPMWVHDLASHRFLAVNDAAVAHYGYSRDEFLGMTIKELRPAHDAPVLLEEAAKPSSSDTLSWLTRAWKHRKKDGTLFDVEIHATTLALAGRPARLVLARDVSAERHLEGQLRHAQTMDAIGRLASAVAHDFNNVLFVIAGHAEQLSRRVDDEGVKARATGLLNATDRGTALVRQLLAFSRSDVHRPTSLRPDTLVADAKDMLGLLLGERIELAVASDPDLGLVRADPGQMQQVLMNLAANARDAMPEGGRLTISTRNVRREAAPSPGGLAPPAGDYVVLSVSDTGTGMDADAQSRIFEPFFTTKPAGQGTGLGLSIVYGIVKQSGGAIEVESAIGRGTTLQVYLPRVPETVDAR